MNAKLTDPQAIRSFILAGDALFTVENRDTGNRYTYKVQAKSLGGVRLEAMDSATQRRFVKVLTGSEDWNFSYIGMIVNGGRLTRTKAVHISPDAQSVKAFTWLWERIRAGKGLPEQVEFWHTGKCGRCGRTLTDPNSIDRGIGPECLKLTTNFKRSLD